MTKRTTTSSTGAVKRTRKTGSRTKTARRTAATPVDVVAPVETAAAVGQAEAVAPCGPTAEQIAERAYFLSLERKGPGGPLDDWLQAERELRNESIPV